MDIKELTDALLTVASAHIGIKTAKWVPRLDYNDLGENVFPLFLVDASEVSKETSEDRRFNMYTLQFYVFDREHGEATADSTDPLNRINLQAKIETIIDAIFQRLEDTNNDIYIGTYSVTAMQEETPDYAVGWSGELTVTTPANCDLNISDQFS